MIPIPKIPEYYPIANQGITILMAGKIDRRRVYGPAKYELKPLYLISTFDKFEIEGELFLLLFADSWIDAQVITSFN